MMKLNPKAVPFFPSPNSNRNRNCNSMGPRHQGYVAPSPPQVTQLFPLPPPPPHPYYQQPYFHGVVREDVPYLHPETTIDDKDQDDGCKRYSKRRFVHAMINGYGRRIARHTNGFRPPWMPRRKNETAGCDRQNQDGTLGDFNVSPRLRKTKHPLFPVKPEDGNTTIMIRNIPNRYTRAMLVDFLDNHCLSENHKLAEKEEGGERLVSAFDIVYLPIDFMTGLNKGYGFVNFTNPEAAWRFYVATNNKKWELFQSHKICDNVAARYQGKDKLVAHLNSMKFPADWEEVLPVCFSPPRDGTVKGSQRTLGKPNGLSDNFVSGRRRILRQWKEKKTPSFPAEDVEEK